MAASKRILKDFDTYNHAACPTGCMRTLRSTNCGWYHQLECVCNLNREAECYFTPYVFANFICWFFSY